MEMGQNLLLPCGKNKIIQYPSASYFRGFDPYITTYFVFFLRGHLIGLSPTRRSVEVLGIRQFQTSEMQRTCNAKDEPTPGWSRA